MLCFKQFHLATLSGEEGSEGTSSTLTFPQPWNFDNDGQTFEFVL